MDLNERIESYKEDMIRDLKILIAHNSVEGTPEEGAPSGKAVAECLDDALKIAQDLGFAVSNVDGYAGEASFGDSEDYVAVLGHLDIVPAGSGWSHDPFKGEIVDGRMYGRGVNDDKGPLIAALYALKALKEEGRELGSTIRIIMGTSEETGGGDIEHYLKVRGRQPKAGFTPDAFFPAINAEKGIINVEISKKLKTGAIEILELTGGNAPNMVPDAAGITYRSGKEEYRIALKGESAHGSTPEKGVNAIVKMFPVLGQLDTRLEDDMAFLSEVFTDVNGSGLDIDLADEASGKLTSCLGLMRYEDGVLKLTVNLRVPVTYGAADIKDPVRLKLQAAGFQSEFSDFTEPLYYPEDLPMIQALMAVYRKVTGDEEAGPMAIGGGTYAKAMDNVVAYGPALPGREDVDHIADEYIYIDDLMTWTKIYAEAIAALSRIS